MEKGIITKIKRVFVGIGICGIGLWMAGCTDETIQEPEKMRNTYMAGSVEEVPAVERLTLHASPDMSADRVIL